MCASEDDEESSESAMPEIGSFLSLLDPLPDMGPVETPVSAKATTLIWPPSRMELVDEENDNRPSTSKKRPLPLCAKPCPPWRERWIGLRACFAVQN